MPNILSSEAARWQVFLCLTNLYHSGMHIPRTVIDKSKRSEMKAQRPAILWFTGISGAGKSTLANLVEIRLAESGIHTYLLDGDNIRKGLNKDLGFTSEDRTENIRRVAEISKLMVDAGLVVVAAFISPFRADREMARAVLSGEDFIEIHLHSPVEVAERRDVKGLYQLARSGMLKDFTGIDSPYETPERPNLKIDTHLLTVEQSVANVMEYIKTLGIVYLRT